MVISLIAALTRNRVIGKNNGLPWHLPDDMKYFMQTTKGHHVLMGRKNYESIPEKFRPLPNRVNMLLTRQKDFNAPQCLIVNSLDAGIDIAQKAGEPELFIIGGSDIYHLGFPISNRLYLTEIQVELSGDTFFPPYDKSMWTEASRTHHPIDDRHAYPFDYVIYNRKQ